MLAIGLGSFNFWVQLIVSLGFLAGMVWGGARGFIAVVQWWHERLASTVAADLQEIRKKTDKVEAQTRNNGGSSLRDAIDRIERNTNALATKLDAVQSDLDRHLGAHEGLPTKL